MTTYFVGWGKRSSITQQKGDFMRQLNRSVGRFGGQERNFSEVQILKFARLHDQNAMNPVAAELHFSANTTPIEVVPADEPTREGSLARGASA
jgi:hypothetical protein